MDTIAEDLIKGDNKTAIEGYFEAGLSKINRDRESGNIPINGDVYKVKTTTAGVISAKKNGADVNLQEELQLEKDVYNNKMEKVRQQSGIEESSQWTAFVEAICPANIFKNSGDKDLQLKDESELYKVVENAVAATTALHGVLPEEADILQILKDSRTAGDADHLGIIFNGYTLDEQTSINKPEDVTDATLAHIAKVLADKDGILVELMENKDLGTPYMVFEANENITDVDNAIQTINERTSRDYTNVDKIRAVLTAVDEAYVGDYIVKVTVTKN